MPNSFKSHHPPSNAPRRIGLGVFLIVALSLTTGPAVATTLPGEPVSLQVQASQKRAEKAFAKGDYERAHWHYRTVLAPAGDKYAHYMLGYLHEHGLGVPRDPARALAWYRLAAERDYELLVTAYEGLAANIRADDRKRAGRVFGSLRERYGDRTLLTRAIKRNERNLRRRTGTRTGGYAGPLYIVQPLKMGMIEPGERYYDALERRIELQYQSLERLGGDVQLGELELIDP